MLSFEMIHIKIVKGIYAYICCIAAYNSALQNCTCTWFRIAIVSVDSSFADRSMLRFTFFGNESVVISTSKCEN